MEHIFLGQFNLLQIFLIFFIYSFLGWCAEVVFATLKTGKFVNRGFLNGCVCPIYGFGYVIVLLCLQYFLNNIILLFFASVVLTSLLEFATGFALEKIFNKKWWDYSKEPFNIKGYVCLRFSILWGLACVFVLKIIHPAILNLINLAPIFVQYILFGVFGLLIILDLVFTIIQLIALKRNYVEFENISKKLKAGSNLLGEKISNTTISVQEKLSALNKKLKKFRLAKAFPNLIKRKNASAGENANQTENLDNSLNRNEDNTQGIEQTLNNNNDTNKKD